MMSLDEIGPVLVHWASLLMAFLRAVDPLWLTAFVAPALVAAASRAVFATLACLFVAGVAISLAPPAHPALDPSQAIAVWLAAAFAALAGWSLRRRSSRARANTMRQTALATELEETRAALEREVFERILRQTRAPRLPAPPTGEDPRTTP